MTTLCLADLNPRELLALGALRNLDTARRQQDEAFPAGLLPLRGMERVGTPPLAGGARRCASESGATLEFAMQ